jgi:hypothetical protein
VYIVERNRRYLTNLGADPRGPLDPHKLYEEQRIRAKAGVTGVGKLVFEFIPFSVIRSFALAIDPFAKFRALPVKITPVNRTRSREVQSVLDNRSYKLIRHRLNLQSFIWSTYGGPPGLFCYGPPVVMPGSGLSVTESTTYPKQPASITKTKDTTSKTRPIGSDFGEFEHFKYTIRSPPENWWFHQRSKIALTMSCNNQLTQTDDYFHTESAGPGGFMSKASIDALQTSEKSELETIMQDKVLQLVSRAVPMSRRYTAFRNVVELKDLPRSILSLKRAVENFHKSLGLFGPSELRKVKDYINRQSTKDIPGEYVSYHFGWKQIVRDVLDLLDKPVRAAREVNRLMRRSGQPTTFRSFSKVAGKTTGSPGFDYPFRKPSQFSDTTETVHRRQHELRCVINATFDFPKINVPRFKEDLFFHKVGVNPMPTDIYNLVPWSWLVDWFTGLGNYVEAIDIINTDKSLINWGVLTGITKGEITTTHRFKVQSTDYREIDHVGSSNNSTRNWTHQSVLEYSLQLRKNVTSAYDVKTILEPSSLSLYQQSILAAILASRRRK